MDNKRQIFIMSGNKLNKLTYFYYGVILQLRSKK